MPRIGAVSLQRSQSALGAAFRRTARRKGYSVVVFSLARKLAILIYRVPRYGQDYLACGEAESEARFQRQRLAGITAAANSQGFELVARRDTSLTIRATVAIPAASSHSESSIVSGQFKTSGV